MKVRFEEKISLIIGTFVVVIVLLFFIFYSEFVFLTFLTEFSAGFLGILIGFSIDRHIELWKNNRTKKNLLRNLRGELELTHDNLFPQTKGVYMLYPDVWDSAVSSGQIRLLDPEQLTKLTTVYRLVRGAQYEAEWVRRAIEECNSVPDSDVRTKSWLENRYKRLWRRQNIRGKALSSQIEKILEEKWFLLDNRDS